MEDNEFLINVLIAHCNDLLIQQHDFDNGNGDINNIKLELKCIMLCVGDIANVNELTQDEFDNLKEILESGYNGNNNIN